MGAGLWDVPVDPSRPPGPKLGQDPTSRISGVLVVSQLSAALGFQPPRPRRGW